MEHGPKEAGRAAPGPGPTHISLIYHAPPPPGAHGGRDRKHQASQRRALQLAQSRSPALTHRLFSMLSACLPCLRAMSPRGQSST